MLKIVEILKMEAGQSIYVSGWIRSFRGNRFIALNDGSCMSSLQIVIESESMDDEVLKELNTGASISVEGNLSASQGSGQATELHAKSIKIIGKAAPEDVQKTILQPKKHSLEKLREQGHLRMRTNLFGAVFRIRHHMAFAIHKYFNDNGYFYIHTPIITATDAEGAGETFRVTTLPVGKEKQVEEKEDFFGKPTHLTVSGQLEAELAALSLGKAYTFGPTFRAENSNTTRHLAEFWMVEPELAFADINDDMDLGEDFLKFLISYAIEHCKEDLKFLSDRAIKEELLLPTAQRNEFSLLERMKMVIDNDFERISYTEAIEILINSKPNKKKKFKYPIEWGIDLQSEHEKFLVEKHFKKPVIIVDYPSKIKAFYMRDNEDGKTVAAMDVLFPGIGEIIGGSQREERYEVLEKKCKEFNVPKEAIWWYLETRKFGTVPHAGFGLGFERLMMFVTGMTNIRDVIPFPRTPKNAEF
jgi:asparaginyl-tRNA synthetase